MRCLLGRDLHLPLPGVKAGETEYIAIPGLSYIIPEIGSVGIDAVLAVAGSMADLQVKVIKHS